MQRSNSNYKNIHKLLYKAHKIRPVGNVNVRQLKTDSD